VGAGARRVRPQLPLNLTPASGSVNGDAKAVKAPGSTVLAGPQFVDLGSETKICGKVMS